MSLFLSNIFFFWNSVISGLARQNGVLLWKLHSLESANLKWIVVLFGPARGCEISRIRTALSMPTPTPRSSKSSPPLLDLGLQWPRWDFDGINIELEWDYQWVREEFGDRRRFRWDWQWRFGVSVHKKMGFWRRRNNVGLQCEGWFEADLTSFTRSVSLLKFTFASSHAKVEQKCDLLLNSLWFMLHFCEGNQFYFNALYKNFILAHVAVLNLGKAFIFV